MISSDGLHTRHRFYSPRLVGFFVNSTTSSEWTTIFVVKGLTCLTNALTTPNTAGKGPGADFDRYRSLSGVQEDFQAYMKILQHRPSLVIALHR